MMSSYGTHTSSTKFSLGQLIRITDISRICPEEEQSLLNRFIEVTEIDTFECYRCHEVYEEEKPDECEKCEGDSFRDEIRREVSVDDEAIHEAAFESLKETSDTLSDNGINFLKRLN